MLNWVKFISAFLLTLITVIVIFIFVNAYKPIGDLKEWAENEVRRTQQIETVYDVQPYQGTSSLVTVFGKNDAGENVAVFVAKTDEQQSQYKEVKLADGITAEDAMKAVKKDQKVDKVLHVLLGMEKDQPIWEVAFKNQNGKLNYMYLNFENGDWTKKILNL